MPQPINSTIWHQQHEADSLGMWVFLLTEIMFFGGAFPGVYRVSLPVRKAFTEASHHLDVCWAASIRQC